MNARLVRHSECQENETPHCASFALLRLPALVGRAAEADIRLDDQWVSRCHCRIEQRDGLLVVTDLHSKHGTWINHRRVDEATMLPGDELEIGLTTLRAEYEAPQCQLH